MKQVYFATLKGDFVDHVFSLACSAYTAIQTGKKVLVIDSDIFDTDFLTKSLEKYDLRVIEKGNLNLKRIAIFYGKGNNVLDITDQAPPFLTPDINLNSLQGDPYPNTAKELFFCYDINGVEYTETYPEIRDQPIVFDATRATYKNDFFWINTVNLPLYNSVISKIKLKKKSSMTGVCHVIHLLSNEDIKQCATQLRKDFDEFKEVVTKKYFEIMTVFIKNKTDTVLVIQKEENPMFIEYLNDMGNPYKLMDLSDANTFAEVSSSTGIFVGVFNMDKLTGSGCSYYLHNSLPNSQSILIDLDMIYKN